MDTPLPLDLDPPSRRTSPGTPNNANTEFASARHRLSRPLREVELHKFGGSIVNSVAIHRFYGGGDGLADEDVVVLRLASDRKIGAY